MATKLENFIRSLLGRMLPDLNKVWKAVKKHPIYKFTANTIVNNAIKKVQQFWQQAKNWSTWTANTIVGPLIVRSSSTPTGKMVVTYTIPVERTGTTPNSHNTSKIRTFATEVLVSMTKSQIMAQIRQEVKDWLEHFYTEIDPQGVIRNIRVKALE